MAESMQRPDLEPEFLSYLSRQGLFSGLAELDLATDRATKILGLGPVVASGQQDPPGIPEDTDRDYSNPHGRTGSRRRISATI